MSRCPFCGSSALGMVTPETWSCGREFTSKTLRTTTCYVREAEELRKKIQRLKDAGDVLCEFQSGPLGKRAIERWKQAKKGKL